MRLQLPVLAAAMPVMAIALREFAQRPSLRLRPLHSSHRLTSSSHDLISPHLLQEFTADIEAMATRCAISTASVYMAEFHDRVSKHWMVEFQEYKTKGFENNNWRAYLEAMIHLDAQNLTALVPLRFGEGAKVPPYLKFID